MGKDPLAWGSDYYQRIGVSFELPNHYQKLTGLENLRFFASLYTGGTPDPMQLLDAVGLADDANTRVGKYSKGMQMRLTLPPYWAAKAFWVASDRGTWWPYVVVGVIYNVAVAWPLFRRFLAKNT